MGEKVKHVAEIAWAAGVPNTIKEVKFVGDNWQLPVGTKLYTEVQPAQKETSNKYCCHLCFEKSGALFLDRMILCPDCGNKRCPKASNHELSCTSSNEAGQEGSVYRLPVKEAQLAVVQLDQIEQYRLQMAAIGTASFGYWKEGDSIKPEYDTVVLRDVAALHKKYEEKSAVVQQLVKALKLCNQAINETTSEMTVGERFTNAGQCLLDALPVVKAALEAVKKDGYE